MKYVLKPAAVGRASEIIISEQEYLEAKRCNKHNFEAFEIELAFDFVVTNYVEIEKYIAEHLVLDMTGRNCSPPFLPRFTSVDKLSIDTMTGN